MIRVISLLALRNFRPLKCIEKIGQAEAMPETRTTAVAIQTENPRATGVLQAGASFLARAGAWAGDTAQEFGAVVAALMGPAVFSGYAIAVWSLGQSLGWTNTFFFSSGALSNWLVWLTIAALVNVAATILRRHTRRY